MSRPLPLDMSTVAAFVFNTNNAVVIKLGILKPAQGLDPGWSWLNDSDDGDDGEEEDEQGGDDDHVVDGESGALYVQDRGDHEEPPSGRGEL